MFRFVTRVFLISFLIGIFVGQLVPYFAFHKNDIIKGTQFTKPVKNLRYENWFKKNGLKRIKISLDDIRYGSNTYLLENQYLYNIVDILCVILVRNSKNVEAAKNTWAKKCNGIHLIYLSNNNKKKMMPTKKTKKNSSWTLLCNAFQKLPNNFRWFLIINDSTFAIPENLRIMLAGFSSHKNYYIGHAVKFWGTIYNTGQAGYVLSNGTLQIFKDKFVNGNSCLADASYMNQEDLYLGKVLAADDIRPIDTRDSLGLTTFHSYNWQHEFFSGVNYYKFSIYPVVCCSPLSVTFQAIEADKMYTYHYILYNLQVFTSGHIGNQPAPTPIPQEEVWQSFLKERGYTNMTISAHEYYKIWENLVHDPTAFGKEVLDQKYDYSN